MENLAYKAKLGFAASAVKGGGRDAKFLWLVFLACALGSRVLWRVKDARFRQCFACKRCVNSSSDCEGIRRHLDGKTS